MRRTNLVGCKWSKVAAEPEAERPPRGKTGGSGPVGVARWTCGLQLMEQQGCMTLHARLLPGLEGYPGGHRKLGYFLIAFTGPL
jgi:hypothetical protein